MSDQKNSPYDAPNDSGEQKRELVRRLMAERIDEGSGALSGASEAYTPCFSQYSVYRALKRKQREAADLGLRNPYFDVLEGVSSCRAVISGRTYVNFAGYNYLGLSGDPEVAQAATEAIRRYGTSVSASRLISGERAIHRELERTLAELIGAEDGVVFVSGHAANVNAIGCLFDENDFILSDALIHNSVTQGAILSGAHRLTFPHNDLEAAERLLAQHRAKYRRALIVVEGVYSMDGNMPDIPGFIELKRRHRTFLMVDEAHSMGVIGKRGFGVREYFDVAPDDIDIWMGTLSKAFAGCGGYIAGSAALVELLKYHAPGFVFSVGMPPSVAGAALAAINRLKAEPQRVERLRQRSRLFLELAGRYGLNTGNSRDSAIIPVMIGDSLKSLRVAQRLFEEGVYVLPILHPAVEEGAGRLRFFITCDHSEEDIRAVVEKTARVCRETL